MYFRRIVGFKGKQSYLMEIGSKFHLDKGQRSSLMNDIYLFSTRLKIGARIDQLQLDGTEAIISEIKRFKTQSPPLGHLLQITTAAIVVEDLFQVEEPQLKIIYHGGSEFKIDNYEELRTLAHSIFNEIRAMIQNESLPKPTSNTEKCKSCEYWKICLQT